MLPAHRALGKLHAQARAHATYATPQKMPPTCLHSKKQRFLKSKLVIKFNKLLMSESLILKPIFVEYLLIYLEEKSQDFVITF